MILIITNGRPRSGKDTAQHFAIEYGKEKVSKFEKISIIDYVKEKAAVFGWDGGKTESDRKFLSDLKDILTEWKNLPLEILRERIEAAEQRGVELLFIDAREPDDIDKIKEFGWETYTVLIENTNVPLITSNHADAEVYNYSYDYIIENNSTLDELKKTVENFINLINFQHLMLITQQKGRRIGDEWTE